MIPKLTEDDVLSMGPDELKSILVIYAYRLFSYPQKAVDKLREHNISGVYVFEIAQNYHLAILGSMFSQAREILLRLDKEGYDAMRGRLTQIVDYEPIRPYAIIRDISSQ